MKKFIPENKTLEWAPECAFLNYTPESVKEIGNSWLNHIKEGNNIVPFSSFLLEYFIIKKINEFVDEFENQKLPLSGDLDLIISDKYYKALSNLIVDGKYRSLNVKTVEMMPPDRMFITASPE